MRRFLGFTAAICLLASPLSAAITRVQSKTATSAAALVGTQTIVFDSTPTAGNVIVLAIGCSQVVFTSVTATNIQFQMVPRIATNGVLAILAIGRVFSSPSATISVTTIGTGSTAIVGAEYSGSGLLRLDKTTGAVGSSTTPASGATDTTTTATELWVGAICYRGTNTATFSSPTNSFSIVGQTGTTTATVNDRSVALLERIVSSTGTANAGATSSLAANNWSAIVGTFEETPTSATTGTSRTRKGTQ